MRARARGPALELVAQRGDAVLDAEQLTYQAAQQHPAEHVERARVAPGQREVDAEHEGDEAEPREQAVVDRLRQAPADEHAEERAGEDRADVDEGPGHASAGCSSSTSTSESASSLSSTPRPGPRGTGMRPPLGGGSARA